MQQGRWLDPGPAFARLEYAAYKAVGSFSGEDSYKARPQPPGRANVKGHKGLAMLPARE